MIKEKESENVGREAGKSKNWTFKGKDEHTRLRKKYRECEVVN